MYVMQLKEYKSPVSRKLKRGLGMMILQQMLIVDNLLEKKKIWKISLDAYGEYRSVQILYVQSQRE